MEEAPNSVLNVKVLEGTFNQEKALVRAFTVIVKTICETDGSFYSTSVQARARGGSVSGVMCEV